MTTSSSSLEFHKGFHDDVLDVFVIGTVFTNEDNNADIEHLKSKKVPYISVKETF